MKQKSKLSPRFLTALTIFSLMGQIAWVVENMYFNVFIYKMFNATPSDISAMVMASAVAATLTTVFMGALSDRVGKRKLFMCGGYILWGISIFSFVFIRLDVIEAIVPMTVSAATVGVSLVIIMDCVMTFFGSTANDAAFNAWLTDSTDESCRGAAEGINAMMPLVAILCVFGGFMAFDLNESTSWTYIFAIIGALTLAVGVLGCFIIKDAPITPSETGYLHNIFYGFRPSTVKTHAPLYRALLVFIIFNISIQIFMPYLILYYEVSLGMSNYVFIMAPAILLAAVVTFFWGKVYDKKGFMGSALPALIWLCAGYVLLMLFKNTALVFVGSLLMMCGYLSGMAVFGALIRDYTPAGKAGMLQGVRIFSQVLIPGLVGPFIGKTVLADAEMITNNDGTTSFIPNASIFVAALCAALPIFLLLLWVKGKKTLDLQRLTTPFEEDMGDVPWSEYPRPGMKRDSYLCLNGDWSLSVLRKGEESEIGKIRVPFPPESRLSGIERRFEKKDGLIYRRKLTLPQGFEKDRLILHFGAVDQFALVAVNGTYIGEHVGGYHPFSLDVTDVWREGENEITVEVHDPLDEELPYGKQRKKRGGMWYTPTSGIWQTVWMEALPASPIERIRIDTTLTCATLTVTGGVEQKTLILHADKGDREYTFEGDAFTIMPDELHLWTPDDPYLYHFTLRSGEDEVQSYFALRTVDVGEGKNGPVIRLNGEPTLFHGLLDQGYFADGIYLPASPEGYRYDIETMKSLGFNMLRKHIKIEPELFYYECDRLGMIVFQDMVNSGRYSFLIDTALPTIGFKKGITHKASPRRRAAFEGAARDTVALLYNHPSVCYYTVFNEGWGQYDADRIYGELKALDPSRIWDATSGWFFEKNSDVQSEHIYFRPVKLKLNPERPVVLSEFGGYCYAETGHLFNPDHSFGYRNFDSAEALTEGLEGLYREQIIPALRTTNLSALVLTQVSDVEDEVNGMVTYDRRVVKVDGARMRTVANELTAAFDH